VSALCERSRSVANVVEASRTQSKRRERSRSAAVGATHPGQPCLHLPPAPCPKAKSLPLPGSPALPPAPRGRSAGGGFPHLRLGETPMLLFSGGGYSGVWARPLRSSVDAALRPGARARERLAPSEIRPAGPGKGLLSPLSIRKIYLNQEVD